MPTRQRPRRPTRAPLRTALIAAPALLALAAAAGAIEPGQPAPDFEKSGLDGRVVSLAAHRGKVVYLDFWASWCGPCAAALPALERLRRELPAADFQILAVNVDRDVASARRFLTRRPVGYPSALDPQGELPERFGVSTMPTSFLIDRRGVVRYVHEGFRAEDVAELRRRIRELLEAGR